MDCSDRSVRFPPQQVSALLPAPRHLLRHTFWFLNNRHFRVFITFFINSKRQVIPYEPDRTKGAAYLALAWPACCGVGGCFFPFFFFFPAQDPFFPAGPFELRQGSQLHRAFFGRRLPPRCPRYKGSKPLIISERFFTLAISCFFCFFFSVRFFCCRFDTLSASAFFSLFPTIRHKCVRSTLQS